MRGGKRKQEEATARTVCVDSPGPLHRHGPALKRRRLPACETARRMRTAMPGAPAASNSRRAGAPTNSGRDSSAGSNAPHTHCPAHTVPSRARDSRHSAVRRPPVAEPDGLVPSPARTERSPEPTATPTALADALPSATATPLYHNAPPPPSPHQPSVCGRGVCCSEPLCALPHWGSGQGALKGSTHSFIGSDGTGTVTGIEKGRGSAPASGKDVVEGMGKGNGGGTAGVPAADAALQAPATANGREAARQRLRQAVEALCGLPGPVGCAEATTASGSQDASRGNSAGGMPSNTALSPAPFPIRSDVCPSHRSPVRCATPNAARGKGVGSSGSVELLSPESPHPSDCALLKCSLPQPVPLRPDPVRRSPMPQSAHAHAVVQTPDIEGGLGAIGSPIPPSSAAMPNLESMATPLDCSVPSSPRHEGAVAADCQPQLGICSPECGQSYDRGSGRGGDRVCARDRARLRDSGSGRMPFGGDATANGAGGTGIDGDRLRDAPSPLSPAVTGRGIGYPEPCCLFPPETRPEESSETCSGQGRGKGSGKGDENCSESRCSSKGCVGAAASGRNVASSPRIRGDSVRSERGSPGGCDEGIDTDPDMRPAVDSPRSARRTPHTKPHSTDHSAYDATPHGIHRAPQCHSPCDRQHGPCDPMPLSPTLTPRSPDGPCSPDVVGGSPDVISSGPSPPLHNPTAPAPSNTTAPLLDNVPPALHPEGPPAADPLPQSGRPHVAHAGRSDMDSPRGRGRDAVRGSEMASDRGSDSGAETVLWSPPQNHPYTVSTSCPSVCHAALSCAPDLSPCRSPGTGSACGHGPGGAWGSDAAECGSGRGSDEASDGATRPHIDHPQSPHGPSDSVQYTGPGTLRGMGPQGAPAPTQVHRSGPSPAPNAVADPNGDLTAGLTSAPLPLAAAPAVPRRHQVPRQRPRKTPCAAATATSAASKGHASPVPSDDPFAFGESPDAASMGRVPRLHAPTAFHGQRPSRPHRRLHVFKRAPGYLQSCLAELRAAAPPRSPGAHVHRSASSGLSDAARAVRDTDQTRGPEVASGSHSPSSLPLIPRQLFDGRGESASAQSAAVHWGLCTRGHETKDPDPMGHRSMSTLPNHCPAPQAASAVRPAAVPSSHAALTRAQYPPSAAAVHPPAAAPASATTTEHTSAPAAFCRRKPFGPLARRGIAGLAPPSVAAQPSCEETRGPSTFRTAAPAFVSPPRPPPDRCPSSALDSNSTIANSVAVWHQGMGPHWGSCQAAKRPHVSASNSPKQEGVERASGGAPGVYTGTTEHCTTKRRKLSATARRSKAGPVPPAESPLHRPPGPGPDAQRSPTPLFLNVGHELHGRSVVLSSPHALAFLGGHSAASPRHSGSPNPCHIPGPGFAPITNALKPEPEHGLPPPSGIPHISHGLPGPAAAFALIPAPSLQEAYAWVLGYQVS